MTQPLYRMHDVRQDGVSECSVEDAPKWNAAGYGLFATINRFHGPRRIECLDRILAWAVDIDEGTKIEQLELIKDGLLPSRIVESKRGYQVYWAAKEARRENWNAIVLDRLVPFYRADPNARDIARILRAPGYFHMKDPTKPFLVKQVHLFDVSYSERQMATFYEPLVKSVIDRQDHEESKKEYRASDDFWENIYNLDCKEGLTRLSGTSIVSCEEYSFRKTSSGTYNILVNGKGTSCWIDKCGRIGSLDKGGPTLFSWLRWFGNKPADCVNAIKQIFPWIER